MLGTADVLISLLDAGAGTFSVPSKILSYLCSSRPIVLCAPLENLASKIIKVSDSGVVSPAGNVKAFVNAVKTMLDDPLRRSTYAANGRSYAERAFDIAQIGTRFETLLQSVITTSQTAAQVWPTAALKTQPVGELKNLL
jgi:glycosyltransferase involved in cell wall biosynthesis